MRVPNVNSDNSKITAIIRAACEFRSSVTGLEFDADLITKNVLSHGKLGTLQLLNVAEAYLDVYDYGQISPSHDPYGLNY